jgi:CRP/FNR family cyclic AMP-dependent transcriptional regulator
MFINDNVAENNLPLNIDSRLWKILLNNGCPKSFGPHEVILLQDQLNEGLVCITKGKIKSSIIYSDGSEKILSLHSAPTLVGEATAFDEGINICNVTALTNVEGTCLSHSAMQKIVFEHPEITGYLISSIASKLHLLALQVKDLSRYNIEQRISRVLCNFQEYGFCINSSDTDYITITHEELANFVSTRRPGVTTCLNNFAQKGLLEIKRGKIRILDHESLKIIAES